MNLSVALDVRYNLPNTLLNGEKANTCFIQQEHLARKLLSKLCNPSAEFWVPTPVGLTPTGKKPTRVWVYILAAQLPMGSGAGRSAGVPCRPLPVAE